MPFYLIQKLILRQKPIVTWNNGYFEYFLKNRAN